MDPRHERADVLPPLSSADALVRAGEPAGDSSTGEMRAKIANAMVGLKKEHFGRGPTAAKAWLLDDYVFVAMEGGLTRNEETLLAAGRESVVRAYRLTFQEVVGQTTSQAIEEITGRKVANYHSQIVFNPTRAFEIFLLEPER
ncbi:MAG: hypothetical protein QOG77_180 [Solirubrobacteraceae bacterium]|jgi:uncharacterized protein YbcI|nr:hypothetical protein [Solirubrobacteraceae bacterium]